MNILGNVGLSAVDRLSAALFHFLWQGAIVALLYAGADRFLKRRGAASNSRYALACGALAVMLLAPIVTFARSARGDGARAGIESARPDGALSQHAASLSSNPGSVRPASGTAGTDP